MRRASFEGSKKDQFMPTSLPGFPLLPRARIFLAALMVAPTLIAAQTPPPAQSPARKFEQDGLKIELAALPPDTTRAFFMGRGFARKDADHLVAKACVFRSAIGSAFSKAGSPAVSIDLKQWQVLSAGHDKGGAAPPRREDWSPVWQARGLSEDAKVAFYWALFPTRQTFAAGDYNWGMLTFGLPAGTKFSLKLVWRTGGTKHETMLKDLTCGK